MLVSNLLVRDNPKAQVRTFLGSGSWVSDPAILRCLKRIHIKQWRHQHPRVVLQEDLPRQNIACQACRNLATRKARSCL